MSQLSEEHVELDLGELLSAILRRYFIIVLITFGSVAVFAYHAMFVAEPQFKATVRFEFTENSGSSAFGQGSSLAALAGLRLGQSNSEALKLEDRILSRPFLASIYAIGDFEFDPVFNPTLKPPRGLKKIRNSLFGTPPNFELSNNDLLDMAIGGLSETMDVKIGDNGIVEISILHPKPERAALIANLVVDHSLQDIFDRRRAEVRDSIEYFSTELLAVRERLDDANAALSAFAITNNLQSPGEFARATSQLADLRNEIANIDLNISALRHLKGAANTEFRGEDFTNLFPIATTLAFRRLLEFSPNPESWQLPAQSKIDEALFELDAQRSLFLRDLVVLEEKARETGGVTLALTKLEREVEVQKTIYSSVITQFETQSLLSGFEQASGTIVERAIPPSGPTTPKLKFHLAFGFLFGFVFSCAIVVCYNSSAGLIHRFHSIQRGFGYKNTLKAPRAIRSGLNNKRPRKSDLISLYDLIFRFDQPVESVCFVPLSEVKSASKLALNFSKGLVELDKKVVLFDLTGSSFFSKLTKNRRLALGEELVLHGFSKNLDIAMPSEETNVLKENVAMRMWEHLAGEYDCLVLLVPPVGEETAVSRTFIAMSPQVAIFAKRGEVRKVHLEETDRLMSNSGSNEPLLIID